MEVRSGQYRFTFVKTTEEKYIRQAKEMIKIEEKNKQQREELHRWNVKMESEKERKESQTNTMPENEPEGASELTS